MSFRLPSKHDHVGHMIYDGDYCVCRKCEQAWELGQYGWKPVDKDGNEMRAFNPGQQARNRKSPRRRK